MIGQIDIGIHPPFTYLNHVTFHLTHLDKNGEAYRPSRAYQGDVHGSQVASIICGPYYEESPVQVSEIKAIAIPRRGKTMLCLLRALDEMIHADIRILCMPIGVNFPTPAFRPFINRLTQQGKLVVVPSGNKGRGTVLSPGSYPTVLTVGALKMSGEIARYSGRTVAGMDFGPKPDIYVRGEFPDPASPGSSKMIQGTSMACAYAVGKAACILEKNPEISLGEIKEQLGVKQHIEQLSSHFLEKVYIDARLRNKIQSSSAEGLVEGIILSGYVAGGEVHPYPIGTMLTEITAQTSCSPVALRPFSVADVVHLRAPGPFFEALLEHEALYCAQAVDVSMFDM